MFQYQRIWSRKKVSVSENLDSIDIDVLFWRRRKRRKTFEKENILFSGGKPEKEKEENIWRRSLKDIAKSRFWFRSRDFCQFLEGFGIGFGEFGLGKKSLGFRFGKIWSWKKV